MVQLRNEQRLVRLARLGHAPELGPARFGVQLARDEHVAGPAAMTRVHAHAARDHQAPAAGAELLVQVDESLRGHAVQQRVVGHDAGDLLRHGGLQPTQTC